MKKSLFGRSFCLVSMIACSVFYALFSWIGSFFGIYLLTVIGNPTVWSAGVIFLTVSAILLLITPLICVLGIVLAARSWKRESYVHAFVRQLLPFATLFWSLVFFVISIFCPA